MYDYVVWTVSAKPGFCNLGALDGAKGLPRGIKMQPWPKNVRTRMDPSFPKSVKLADNISNLAGAIIVSQRLKEFIEKHSPPKVEYLPLAIVNHKGHLASKDYFIINPLMVEDCIDKGKSDIEWNPLDKELIAACFDTVIIESEINPQAVLFRLKHYPTQVLVKRELAESINAESFSGIRFIEIEDIEY